MINIGFEYQQWNIISEKESGALWDVILLVTENIENYIPTRDGVGSLGVLKTTGPIPYTNAISSSKSKFRFAGNNEVNGILYRDRGKDNKRKPFNHYRNNTESVTLCGGAFYLKLIKIIFLVNLIEKAIRALIRKVKF